MSSVSIPHSGFWPFKPSAERMIRMACLGFNPPLGILAVQAPGGTVPCKWRLIKFQSPTRDSGRSSAGCDEGAPDRALAVSIPHSGFWPFKPRSGRIGPTDTGSFNPPLGILAVQASTVLATSRALPRFQSPTRDSGRSSQGRLSEAAMQAEFQSPTRDSGRSSQGGARPGSPLGCPRFNPPLGILAVQAEDQ
mgnify:CR=1 FL=1